MIHINHLGELLALCGAGLFTSTVGFAALWIRARDRATRAESLLEGMRLMGGRDGTSTAIDAIAEEGNFRDMCKRVQSMGAKTIDELVALLKNQPPELPPTVEGDPAEQATAATPAALNEARSSSSCRVARRSRFRRRGSRAST